MPELHLSDVMVFDSVPDKSESNHDDLQSPTVQMMALSMAALVVGRLDSMMYNGYWDLSFLAPERMVRLHVGILLIVLIDVWTAVDCWSSHCHILQ